LAPASGISYIGLVYLLSSPGSQESAGQTLATPMTAGNTYAISLSLVNLDIYNASWNGGTIINIYGGATNCSFTQLLWSSGSISNSTWVTFNAILTPTSNWSRFVLRVHPGTASTFTAAGVDNLLSVPLPAKLEGFQAQLQGDVAAIDWQTSEEQNMESYTVERASSDMKFMEIKTIPASGTTGLSQHYQVLDADLPQGLSYYRLRMNDQNGTASYSEIKELLYSTTGEHFIVYGMGPNPANEFTRMEVYSLLDQDATVRVIDVAGKVIHEVQQPLSMGANEFTLTTTDWPAALYRVQVIAGGKAATKSLVVAH
jgi:hypothetical protein